MSSHYPKFTARRPRVHPHSRYYEVPVQSSSSSSGGRGSVFSSSASSSLFSFGLGLSGSGSGNGEATTTNFSNGMEPPQKRNLAAKLLVGFFGSILLVGLATSRMASSTSSSASSSSLPVLSESKRVASAVETTSMTTTTTTSEDVESSGNSTERDQRRKEDPIVQDMQGQHYVHGRAVEVAPELDAPYFVDVTDWPLRETDRAVFWHVPRSGGRTVREITALCYELVQASNLGRSDIDIASVGGSSSSGSSTGTSSTSDTLMAVEHLEGGRYVNVDTTTPEGLQRAIDLNLASFEELQIVVTPYLRPSAALFSEEYRGRLSMLFRHPIERAVSMYYFLRANGGGMLVATGAGDSDESGNSVMEGQSLEQYSRGELAEDNWLTRSLVDRMQGELTNEHLAQAREFVRRKVLVGLMSHAATSLERFRRYYGWKAASWQSTHKLEACQDQILNWNWPNKNRHPRVREDSSVWKNLAQRNRFDLQLYEYATQLFHEQAALFDRMDTNTNTNTDHNKQEQTVTEPTTPNTNTNNHARVTAVANPSTRHEEIHTPFSVPRGAYQKAFTHTGERGTGER